MVATKKAKPGAFKRNNAGPAGLRNTGVDATDEPDAGVRANVSPLSHLHTHTHIHP